MSYIAQNEITPLVIPLTTAADGSCTATSAGRITGRLHAIQYSYGTLTGTPTITITTNDSARSVLAFTATDSTNAWYYPRVQVHGLTATGLTYDGTYKVSEPAIVYNEQIKVVVADGGATKAGTITVFYTNP